MLAKLILPLFLQLAYVWPCRPPGSLQLYGRLWPATSFAVLCAVRCRPVTDQDQLLIVSSLSMQQIDTSACKHCLHQRVYTDLSGLTGA